MTEDYALISNSSVMLLVSSLFSLIACFGKLVARVIVWMPTHRGWSLSAIVKMIVGEGTFGEIVDYDEGIAVVAAA